MNKKELTAKVVKKTGMTGVDVQKVIDAVFHSIKESLENGESNTYHDFGSFHVHERMERRGVNPATKKPMIIPARKVVRFTPSKSIVVK